MQDAASWAVDIPALAMGGTPLAPGVGLRTDRTTEGLAKCIRHSGKKVQLSAGTGDRVELLFSRTGWDVASLLRILGIAPPAVASANYEAASRPLLEVVKSLTGPEPWFAIVRSRDDGVFSFQGLKFDLASLPNDVSADDRLQWIRQRCGTLVSATWREQARRVQIFRSTARFRQPGAAFDPLATQLWRSDILHVSAEADQSDPSGSRLREFQQRESGFKWLPERFWEDMIKYAPIEIIEISADSAPPTIASRQNVTVARVAQSYAEQGPIVPTQSASPTHLSLVPIDRFLPDTLKAVGSATPEAEKSVDFFRYTQAAGYGWVTNRARVLRMLDDVSQAIGTAGNTPSVLASGSTRDQLLALRDQLQAADRSGLHYLELARARLVELTRAANTVSISSVGSGYSGPTSLTGPTWTEGGSKLAALGSLWPLPPHQIERLGTLWRGSCTGQSSQSNSQVLPKEKLMAALRSFAESTYETGFIVATPDDIPAFLSAIGHTIVEVSQLASGSPKWDGSRYKLPFGKKPPVQTKSDVLIVAKFNYPLDPIISVSATWSEFESGQKRRTDMVPVVLQSRDGKQQGLVGIFPCVDIVDMVKADAAISFTANGRQESLRFLWKINEPFGPPSPNTIPKWWADQVNLSNLRANLGQK